MKELMSFATLVGKEPVATGTQQDARSMNRQPRGAERGAGIISR